MFRTFSRLSAAVMVAVLVVPNSAARAQQALGPAAASAPTERSAGTTIPAGHKTAPQHATYAGMRPTPPPVYPQLGAPLYPAPQQTVPPYQGQTLITNQALAPHEMLYRHKYRALYPPFYYKVRGAWIWTPFGIQSHDIWTLQGTRVTVRYKPRYGLFSGFIPPVLR